MKREHAAIIARARRDGLKPVELAAELMGYTLVEAMRDASASQSVAFSKMSEVQQDSCIQQWTEATKEAIDLAIQVIASAGTRTVRMDLTSVAVGKKLKVAGVVAGTEEYKHDLIDLANDQGTAIVILNERDYLQGLDGIKGEKDQRPLDIEPSSEPATTPAATGKGSKAAAAKRASSPTSAGELAKKAIEIPAKMLEDARTFVTTQQNCKASALQNLLKVGAVKVAAVLEKLAEEGVVEFVGDEKTGEYQLVRNKPEVKETADSGNESAESGNNSAESGNESGKGGKELSFDGINDELPPVTLTDEIYAQIKAKVIKDKRVSVGALSITFDLSEEVADQAIDRLEMDGVISAENEELGTREVLEQAE